MFYTPFEEKKEVLLNIKTVIFDESERSFDQELMEFLQALAESDDAALENLIDSANEDEEVSKVKLSTVASISTEGNNVTIAYSENEDDPALKTDVRIMFSADDPGLVVMEKKGAIYSALSFEEGKTHICEYKTPFMPFKMYITSNQVENRILQDGRLNLEYILNISETAPQRFVITVSMKDSPLDPLKDFFSQEQG